MTLRTTRLGLGISLAMLAVAAAPSGAKAGTDILHITLRVNFVANADADAEGALAAMLRQQGKANVQKLRLQVSNLAADSTYHMYVWLAGAGTPTEVLSFDTDENGEARLKLMRNGKKSFPVGLDPLSDVQKIEIRDSGDAVAMDADLTNPGWLQYLVKRQLDNDGVDADADGTLFLKEHDSQAQFRLRASNLDANTDYTLAINGADVGTFTSDDEGRLEVEGLPAGAPMPFDMTSLELLDALDQSVLSTELP